MKIISLKYEDVDSTIMVINKFEKLNHLFQECKTGLPVEYGTISQIISLRVLAEIANWVL
ncbi:MAG: hypothetical protein CSB01_04380 [Bacteroidia bacterium]|nr:MAG: hypothetical protein CSB01_04380 [Bacteroidia bacterium]